MNRSHRASGVDAPAPSRSAAAISIYSTRVPARIWRGETRGGDMVRSAITAPDAAHGHANRNRDASRDAIRNVGPS